MHVDFFIIISKYLRFVGLNKNLTTSCSYLPHLSFPLQTVLYPYPFSLFPKYQTGPLDASLSGDGQLLPYAIAAFVPISPVRHSDWDRHNSFGIHMLEEMPCLIAPNIL